MINLYISNGLRFIVLVLIQGLLLQEIPFEHVNIYLYPLFILLLPLRMPPWGAIALSFGYGLCMDMFYSSQGLHAAVATLAAFVRPYLIFAIEPRGGYEVDQYPTMHSLGLSWFLRYAAIFLFGYIFFVLLLEELGFSLLFFLRLLITYSLSLLFVMLYQFLLNPKQ